MIWRRIAPWLLLFSLMPRTAPAANGSKPRIPVIWTDPACIQVVDPGSTPVLHLDYSVASEETQARTDDEVDDSRTHQFFAFSSQSYATSRPRWITQADIDRAALVDPMVDPDQIDPQEILEFSAAWPAGSWLRITPDDARVPITFAQAAMGVDWDLSEVPSGTWWVWGYTWEPLNNLWAPRWGAVKVLGADGDPDGAEPTVVLLSDEVQLEVGQAYEVPGCVDAPVGSTVSLEWGVVVGTAEPEWTPAVVDAPAQNGSLGLSFEPPAEASNQTIRLRATVRDPGGRTVAAYSPKTLFVGPGAGSEGGAGDGGAEGAGEGGCNGGSVDPGAAGPWVFGLLGFVTWRRRTGGRAGGRARGGAALATALAACTGDDSGHSHDTGTSAGDTAADGSSSGGESGDLGQAPSSGPLMCPPGEQCTLVLVSQALDDRVEIFAARGAGPTFRGAIDLDLKPNPMGDIEGELLDEPYGLVADARGLGVLVGHFPSRQVGSWVWIPQEFLSAQPVGEVIRASRLFADGEFVAPVVGAALNEEEPIFATHHPSGRVLVGVFGNDLLVPDTAWTEPGKLLVLDPADPGAVGVRDLGSIGRGCAGAWSLVPLDDRGARVALACDGDESAVVLDVSSLGEGSVEQAAAAITGCQADIPFMDKRVRYLAPDGQGGFVVAETPPIATGDDGRLWHFDGACAAQGAPGTIPGGLFEAREIVHWATAHGSRWLMATGRTAERGVQVVRQGESALEVCGVLSGLDTWWTSESGQPLDPFALALAADGRGLAIGAGPPEPGAAAFADGRVLWVELDPDRDPCGEDPVQSVVDLAEAAPARAEDPTTWRRAPNFVRVVQW